MFYNGELKYEEKHIYNMCYVFSYQEEGMSDLEKFDSFLYDIDTRKVFNGFISYDDGGLQSFDETIKFCKDKGFDITF